MTAEQCQNITCESFFLLSVPPLQLSKTIFSTPQEKAVIRVPDVHQGTFTVPKAPKTRPQEMAPLEVWSLGALGSGGGSGEGPGFPGHGGNVIPGGFFFQLNML